MKLSKTEEKLVRQIDKRSRAWGTFKYIYLVLAAIILTAVFFMFHKIHLAFSDNIQFYTLIMVFFVPVFFFNCALCGFWLGNVIRDWNGNATDILLLKLIDEMKNKNQNTSFDSEPADTESE